MATCTKFVSAQPTGPHPGDAVTDLADSPEFLYIQVEQLPGMFALVTHHRHTRLQVSPT